MVKKKKTTANANTIYNECARALRFHELIIIIIVIPPDRETSQSENKSFFATVRFYANLQTTIDIIILLVIG